MKIGFAKEGRITALDMFVICDNGPMTRRRLSVIGTYRFPVVSAASDALARSNRDDQHAAAQRAEFARRNAGHRHYRADHRESCAQTGLDQVAIRRMNCPEGKAEFGAAAWNGTRHMSPAHLSRKRSTAARKNLIGRNAWRAAEAHRIKGARRRRVRELLCRRHNRIRRTFAHHARRPRSLSIGNRKSRHGISERRAPRRRGNSRRAVGKMRRSLGQYFVEFSVHLC